MGTLTSLASLVSETLGSLTVSQGAWTYVRRLEAVQVGMLLLVLIVATLVTRYVRSRRPVARIQPCRPFRPDTGSLGHPSPRFVTPRLCCSL